MRRLRLLAVSGVTMAVASSLIPIAGAGEALNDHPAAEAKETETDASGRGGQVREIDVSGSVDSVAWARTTRPWQSS